MPRDDHDFIDLLVQKFAMITTAGVAKVLPSPVRLNALPGDRSGTNFVAGRY
jgi:hypothetical protein